MFKGLERHRGRGIRAFLSQRIDRSKSCVCAEQRQQSSANIPSFIVRKHLSEYQALWCIRSAIFH